MNPRETLDPSVWRRPSEEELLRYIDRLIPTHEAGRAHSPSRGRRLTFDMTLDVHSVSLYCYLKWRFGAPNGVAMMMGDGGTQDLYHWHYTLLSAGTFFDIHSTQMGIEFQCPDLEDSPELEQWLKGAILADMDTHRNDIAREKQRLENWTIFVNPYQRLDEVISGLEARASGFNLALPKLKPMTIAGGQWNEDTLRTFEIAATEYGERLADAQTVGLSVKMVVPIWVESFINLVLFFLAHDKVKRDKRLFDSYFRQHIDVRVKMLPSVCKGFLSDISDSDPEFRNFFNLFQCRNDLLHGNIDVKQLQVDRMFFDGMIPLYEEWKSDYERRLAPVMAFIDPSAARKDILTGSEFIIYLANKLEPVFAKQLWAISSSPILGYRKDSGKLGILFDGDVRMLVPRTGIGDVGRQRSLQDCEPPPESPCLCGSGATFGACCRGRYGQGHLHSAHELLARGDFRAALIEARRYVCWYSLCHLAHTKPLIESADEKAEPVLAADISAMTDIVRLLRTLYQKADIADEYPQAIVVLRNAIADSRWHSRIQMLLAEWWAHEKHNRQEARRALSESDIDNCYDEEVLMCYLSVCGGVLSPEQRIDLATRISELTDDAGVRLNYSAMTSAAFLEQDAPERSIDILEKAITQYNETDKERRSEYGDLQCAHSIQLLGRLQNDEGLLRDAAARFQVLIDNADATRYTTAYFADCLRAIGECHLLLGDHRAAIESLQKSLDRRWDNFACILLVKAHLGNDDWVECRDALGRIAPTTLSEENYYDYAMALASIELRVPTLKGINEAKAVLKETRCRSAYFRTQRDSTLIALLEAQNQLLTSA